MNKGSDLLQIRREKLEKFRENGQCPFSNKWKQKHFSKEAKGLFKEYGGEVSVSVAGRILFFRLMGKAAFIKLLDQEGQIQVYVTRDELGTEAYADFKKYDLGDIVGVEGTLFKTKTGEITVRAKNLVLLSKSLRPLPEKWHGLTDNETVYRQRYLDLIVNNDSRERFFKRTKIVQEIRKFFWERKFIEVETPVLQDIAGGAAARPFKTHMNSLHKDFYLRICFELFLKRMLISGYDKVFEMGRVFRNEGLSRRHNPEFTMLEIYEAYSDYRGMMSLMYDLVQHLCKEVIGTTSVKNADGETIELGGRWREVSYRQLIFDASGRTDWFELSKEDKLKICDELKIEVNPELEDFEITKNVFEKCVEPNLIQPTFVTHLPKELCPLAKLNSEDPSVLDVFELCINGQEIAPAYSEQNDPDTQRKMFEIQAGEDVQNIDQDFLEAMEYGMPPAGGMGIGIDRLIILLTEAYNIRDTILYPTLK